MMEHHAVKQHTLLPPQAPVWLTSFVEVYQKLSTDNLGLLETIYHNNVTFIDPVHQIEGFDCLYAYFERLYENLSSCDFIIEKVVSQDQEASLYWKMVYQHSKLNQGNKVTVQGCTHIKGHEGKVIYHRDYLDLGAMVYEQLPIFGRLIKWIKTKVAE